MILDMNYRFYTILFKTIISLGFNLTIVQWQYYQCVFLQIDSM